MERRGRGRDGGGDRERGAGRTKKLESPVQKEGREEWWDKADSYEGKRTGSRSTEN